MYIFHVFVYFQIMINYLSFITAKVIILCKDKSFNGCFESSRIGRSKLCLVLRQFLEPHRIFKIILCLKLQTYRISFQFLQSNNKIDG